MPRKLIFASASFIALLLVLCTVEPTTAPSLVLMLPFLLLFVCLALFGSYVGQKFQMQAAKSTRLAVLCAAVPVLFLVLASIGQLSLRDVVTIVALFILSYFYLLRSSAPG